MKSFRLIILLFILSLQFANAQTQFGQVPIQGIIETADAVLNDQDVSIRASIFNVDKLVYEELHNVKTNKLGLFFIDFGNGLNTGNGSATDFFNINWSEASLTLVIESDLDNSGVFRNVGKGFFQGVPFANYAKNSGSKSFMSLFNNNQPELNHVVIWTGQEWVPNKIDNVIYSEKAYHVSEVDTASFAINGISTHGNTGEVVVHTDQESFKIKTKNIERFTFTSDGTLKINNSNLKSFNFDNGFLTEGKLDSASRLTEKKGNHLLWNPTNNYFRIGHLDLDNYTDSLAGLHSFAGGFNSVASNGTFAFGNNVRGTGRYSLVLGENSTTTYKIDTISKLFGMISIGYGTFNDKFRQVTMGYESKSLFGSTAVSMGYQTYSRGILNYCMGYRGVVNDIYGFSMGIGYYPEVRSRGTFVYTDASNIKQEVLANDQQFLVRASGGSSFYTNSDLGSGVTLKPGDGAWSNVSDVHAKQNFEKVNFSNVLNKISGFDISSWNYISQSDSILHIGPMAQDFFAKFTLGKSNKYICTSDMDGIIMAGIKGVDKKLLDIDRKFEKASELKKKIEDSESSFLSINNDLEKLDSQIKQLQKIIER